MLIVRSEDAMALELVDLPGIKVHPEAHAFFKAKAEVQRVNMNELIRQVLHDVVLREISIFTLADNICKSKELGGLTGDFK